MLDLRSEEQPIVTTWPTLGPPPRTVRVRRNAWLLIAGIPALALVFGGLAARADTKALAPLEQIVADGHETPARLVGRRRSGSSSRSEYYVVSEHRVGGRRYRPEFRSRALFDSARQNQVVTVSYAAANPWIAELGTREEVARKIQSIREGRWGKPGLLLAVAVAFSLYTANQLRKQLALARVGVLRWSTVTEVQVFRSRARVTLHVDDNLGEGTATCSASAEFGRHQPVGSRAAILSDPAAPSRFALCETVMSSVTVVG
jgi:hypothetical protein